MTTITAVLRAVAPRANASFVAASANLGAIAQQRGFDTVEAQAMLIAHTAHECAGYTAFSENLRYSAKRLTEVWPSRFPTAAAAQPYANNPQALANKVYNGRMGNRVGSDDGWDFRGSACLQHTGRSEFERVQKRTGMPVLEEPDLLRDPAHADVMWQAACTFFVDRGVLAAARAGNVEAATLKINGGRNGLADRKLLYARALAALQGQQLPAGRTTREQADDAKRRAKQVTTTTAAAAPAAGGATKQANGADWSTAIGIGLCVLLLGAVAAVVLWRAHKQKQAEVETMQLQGIALRALAES